MDAEADPPVLPERARSGARRAAWRALGCCPPAVPMALAVALAACAGRGERPRAPSRRLDLRGARVMVLPVQAVRGVTGDVDAEIAFALRERGRLTAWVFPPELQAALARNRGVAVRLDALPVGIFRRVQVKRIGDPLYGELRRLAALSGADVAVVPIEARTRPAGADSPAAVEIVAAAIDARLGSVLWFGVVSSPEPDPHGPTAPARAADALARALLQP